MTLVERRRTMEVILEGTEVLVLREILEDVIAKHTREIGAATRPKPERGSGKGSFFSSRSSRSSPLSSPRYDGGSVIRTLHPAPG
jgi:hypothetical protein